MIAIAIESSNSRGMGHLFRAILYVNYLKKRNMDYIVLINQDVPSLAILKQHEITYEIVDYQDVTSDWESQIIKKYQVDIWFNDKFETNLMMGKHIKANSVLFCMIDDIGEAEVVCDLYFAGMIAPTKKEYHAKKVYSGSSFMVLNPQIEKYKRSRQTLNKVIVSMGGSDPYLVTFEVLKQFLTYDYEVDFVIGPNYREREQLLQLNNGRFKIMQNVPSLIQLFYDYDLAITGGGVTCCEANASGLPALIIANAPHEVNTGRFMEQLGSAKYLGLHGEWDVSVLKSLREIDLSSMSKIGREKFNTNAVADIFEIIIQERKRL